MEVLQTERKVGLPLRKYTGQSDVSLVVVCHEVIAEIMGMIQIIKEETAER